MATTNLKGSGDATTVVIDKKYAPFIAQYLMYELSGKLETLASDPIATPADVAQFRRTLDHYERLLEQVAWGQPEGDVEFCADTAFLTEMGGEMMASDMHARACAHDGMTEAYARRWYVDEVNAGASILDQLEATR